MGAPNRGSIFLHVEMFDRKKAFNKTYKKVEKFKFLEELFEKGLILEVLVSTPQFSGKFKTIVEDMDDKFIYIDAPIVRGDLFQIPHKTEIKAFFVNKNGKFVIKTNVFNKNNISRRIIPLVKPEYMYLIQRRSFFRVEVYERINAELLKVDRIGDKINLNRNYFSALMVDLSGGGTKLFNCIALEEGNIIELLLNKIIDDIGQIIGKVVRVYRDKGLSYGIEFLSIKRKDQAKIVMFALQKQIKESKIK